MLEKDRRQTERRGGFVKHNGNEDDQGQRSRRGGRGSTESDTIGACVYDQSNCGRRGLRLGPPLLRRKRGTRTVKRIQRDAGGVVGSAGKIGQ